MQTEDINFAPLKTFSTLSSHDRDLFLRSWKTTKPPKAILCSAIKTTQDPSSNSCACSRHDLVLSRRCNTELLVPSRSSFSWAMAGWEVCIKALYSAAMAPHAACICLSVYQVSCQANTQNWGLDWYLMHKHYHKTISFRGICLQTYIYQLETEVSSLFKGKCKLRWKKIIIKKSHIQVATAFPSFPNKRNLVLLYTLYSVEWLARKSYW